MVCCKQFEKLVKEGEYWGAIRIDDKGNVSPVWTEDKPELNIPANIKHIQLKFCPYCRENIKV